jgi:predicted PurR-regulated permease PerM
MSSLNLDPRSHAETDHAPLSYDGLKRWLGLVLFIGAVFFLIWSLKSVVLLFAIVFLLAMVLNPAIVFLEQRGIKRGLAVALVALFHLAVLFGVFSFIVPPVLEQLQQLSSQLPQYWSRSQGQTEILAKRYPGILNVLPQTDQLFDTVRNRIDAVLPTVIQSAFQLLGGLFGLILGVLLLLFVLLNPTPLVSGFLRLVPERQRDATSRTLLRLNVQMFAWARGVVVNGLVVGLTTGLLMWWIGIQPALVFGVIAFLGEFFPMVGPVLASIPAIFVALGLGLDKFLLACAAFLFVHQVETNLLVPFIFGRTMDLHPVVILFFFLAMSTIFGLIGAILAVPAVALSKILIEEFYLRTRTPDEKQITSQARQIVYGRR